MPSCVKIPVTLAIPAFNEASLIGGLLSAIISSCEAEEILVVDDCSSDETAEIARAIDGVTLVRHSQRRGQTAAWQTALLHAKHDIVVFCDADARPELGAIQILARAIAQGADLAGGVALPWPKAWPPARFSALLIRELANLGVRDFQLIGRFFATRRAWLLCESFPPDVISNDLWLLRTAQRRNRSFIYCPAATVRYTAPSTVRDFKLQRIRAAAGCRQLRLWGLSDRVFRRWNNIVPLALLRAAVNDPVGAISWVVVQILIATLPWPRVQLPKGGIWEPALSTKKRS